MESSTLGVEEQMRRVMAIPILITPNPTHPKVHQAQPLINIFKPNICYLKYSKTVCKRFTEHFSFSSRTFSTCTCWIFYPQSQIINTFLLWYHHFHLKLMANYDFFWLLVHAGLQWVSWVLCQLLCWHNSEEIWGFLVWRKGAIGSQCAVLLLNWPLLSLLPAPKCLCQDLLWLLGMQGVQPFAQVAPKCMTELYWMWVAKCSLHSNRALGNFFSFCFISSVLQWFNLLLY